MIRPDLDSAAVRVLLIDDDPDARVLTIRQLRRELDGVDAEEIADARGFERALAAGDFDAVITDYQLGWTDGLSVLRAVREHCPECPVIMFTGTGTEEVAVEAMKAGLDDYIVKTPAHLIRIGPALRAALARARQRRAFEAAEARRRQLEEELRRRLEELAEQDRRKDEFMAMLAHELRNPLGALSNAVHLLHLRAGQESEIRRPLGVMERQIRHMGRLLDDLLNVARITQGKLSLRRARIDLREVVEHAVEAVRSESEARGHELSLSLPPEPLLLDGDAARLEQVFSNLLGNAVKFTAPGGTLRLTAAQTSPPDPEIVVRVHDTGDGIDPDLLPHIFEPFVQADRSLARSEGGLGLGLMLVRSLVDLHGGRVEVHSDGPGHGAEFVVRLPPAASG